MDTGKLVDMLARNAEPVPRHPFASRYAVALAVGGLVAFVMLAAVLGVRRDLADAVRDPMFWVKLGYPALLLAFGTLAFARLGRPGASARAAAVSSGLPVAAVWALAAAVLAGADPSQRTALVMGSTWAWCLASVSILAVPTFVTALWAMKGLAPTRPAIAGACCGLVAGAVGAAVYTLHCPEMAAPFIATWYTLGMAVPVALGAVVGPRVLRW